MRRLAAFLAFGLIFVSDPSFAQPPQAKVSYLHDVHPILAKSCVQCHSASAAKGNYRIDSRENLLKGGDTGPAILAGNSEESYLIHLVEGRVEGMIMPMKGPRLTSEEIGILRRWIDEGVEWTTAEQAAEQKRPIASVKPRRPEIPMPGAWARSANPVDLILQTYFTEKGIEPAAPVGDEAFARRVYIDVIGLLPSTKELDDFAADRRWDKREALVSRLLDDKRAYAENWMTFWNDALRNDFAGTGYIDGGREQITPWLYEALAANKPFDRFVRELINPDTGSRGFIKGIVWRGVTNSSQTPQMQAAQNISQVFMGTNMKCASCHDSFINQWKLKDSYGLAAIFSDEKLELVRCDAPTGEMAEMNFLYPELGKIDPALPKEKRLELLAEIMSSGQNGRLARTIVNRLWAKFLGRGLVEPLDDMDQPPWNADLLDWLAVDLADNGFDLKHAIRRIMSSQAYQMPSVPLGEQETEAFVFRGPAVRRLEAEQLMDGLSCVTGVWQKSAAAQINLEIGSPEDEALLKEVREGMTAARWIWEKADAAAWAPAKTIYFRKTIKLPTLKKNPLKAASMVITCDNDFKLFVNGKRVAKSDDFTKPVAVDLRSSLREGYNSFAVEATNSADSPAGLIAFAHIRTADEKFDFGSDGTWLATNLKFKEWESRDFFPLEWGNAAVTAEPGAGPWNLGDGLVETLHLSLGQPDRVRAWLTRADPLARALGRPNREQVVTRRPSVATTLQMLEMTNGETLAAVLQQGAAKLLEPAEESAEKDSASLIPRLFRKAIARPPTPQEIEIATAMIGSPPTKEGMEDFLWSLLMLPEFQLIY